VTVPKTVLQIRYSRCGVTPRSSSNAVFSYFWALSGCHIPSKYLASRDYYDQKRGQGKRHNQALIALAHRRLTVLFAMIRDGSLYDVPELKIA